MPRRRGKGEGSIAQRSDGRWQGRVDLYPRSALRTLHALQKRAGVPRKRFHDLRHTAASGLIAKGVELVEVSQLLGHSQLSIRADLYADLQKQTAAKAAQQMDALLDVQNG